jgi:2-dehydropantoate 2-reductase
MSAKELPIAVVGAGTVGSLLIAHLIEAGHEDVAVVDIPSRLEQIRDGGIKISKVRTIDVKPQHLFSDIEELADRGVRTLVVATKATQICRVSPKIQKIHHPDMFIISMQNGLGTEREIATYVPPDRVGRMTVNFAGVRDEDTGDVAMSWFIPPNVVGPFIDSPLEPYQEFAALLTEIGLDTEAKPTTDVKRAVWFKAILNAALNALCATTGLTMAESMRMRHTRYLARQLLREGLTVASHMGYAYGEGVLETCMNYLDKGGEHYPSMWSDLKKGRRTEIDYINGKIVKNAMMYTDINADLNMFFTNMVMTQEIRSGVRKVQEIPSYLGCTVRLCY